MQVTKLLGVDMFCTKIEHKANNSYNIPNTNFQINVFVSSKQAANFQQVKIT